MCIGKGKGKVHPRTGHKGPEGEGGQFHTLTTLRPGKRPGTHCIGGWVDPRTSLDGCRKSCLPLGFSHQTVQPVVSRYTDYTLPAHKRA
jgi:hypothetical protein